MSRHLLAAAATALAVAALIAPEAMDPAALLRAARGIAGAVAVAAAATGLGAALLTRLGGGEPASAVAAFALGGAALGTLLLLPAALGLTHPLVFLLAVALAAAAWATRPAIRWPEVPPVAWVVGLALLAPGALDALAPPVDTDEIYYHMALPAMLLREGVLPGGWWLPDGSRPLVTHLLDAAAMALGGEPGPKLLHWLGAGALMVAVRDIGQRHIGERAGDVAALLLLGSYSVMRASGLANNDLPAALLVVLALGACLDRQKWALAAFAGAALATKYTAAGPVVGLYLLWWKRRGLRAAPELAVMTAAALAWVAPWWLRNLAGGLHPLFPFMGWEAMPDFQFMYPEKYGMGRGVGDLLLLPWRATAAAAPDSHAFLGRVTPAALACLPGAVWALVRGRGGIVAVAAVAFAAWAGGVHVLRLLLPAVGVLALAAAVGWRELAGWGRAAVLAVWLLALPMNLGPWLGEVADRAPAAVGWEDREDLLARAVRDWAAVAWINAHSPEDARVALLFSWPRYHLERPVILGSVEDHVPSRYLLLNQDDALGSLREQGVTHVLAHRRPFVSKTYDFIEAGAYGRAFEGPVDALQQALLAEGTLVFEQGRVGVWRIRVIAASPWVKRAVGWLVDLAALYVAISLRLDGWPRAGAPRNAPADIPASWWEWGALHDTILAGPDAGAWANNVRSVVQGLPLDTNRLPTYSYLSAWATRWFDDVIFAGHFVNHMIGLAIVALTYFLGRSTSGRAAGFAAAALVALSDDLIESQAHYGGDPATQLVLLLVITTSWLAVSGRAAWVLVAGACMGLAFATHFLTIIYLPAALLLLLLAPRRWWARLLGVLVAAGVGWLVWTAAMHEYPPVTVEQVKSIFAEGASSHGRGEQGDKLTLVQAAELALSRSDGALAATVGRGLAELGVSRLSWGLVVGLFWLGVFGPGLRRKAGPAGWDWRPAVWLLVFMAPLLPMEMAHAPPRYGLYARPLLFLAVARGAASLGALLDLWLRRYSGYWPVGVLGFVPALLLVDALEAPMKAQWNLFPPTQKGLTVREAGVACVEHFGAGGGIATTNRDLAFHAERLSCMNVPCQGTDDVALGQCLEALRVRCPGDSNFPYVIESRAGHHFGDGHGFGDQQNPALDALVAETFEQLGEWKGAELNLAIYDIERDKLSALARELAGDRLRSVEPQPPPPR